MRGSRLLVIVLALASGPGIRAQDAVAPTGVISGVVTDLATGAPLGGVSIHLTPPAGVRRSIPPSVIPGFPSVTAPEANPYDTETDGLGRFVFTKLPAGRYSEIRAHLGGFVDASFKIGVPAAGDRTTIMLADGEKFTKADIGLVGLASIAGRVVDEHLDAMPDVFVQLLVSESIAGRSRLFGGPTARTDAQGTYTFTGVTPGTYRVMALSTQHTRSNTPPPARVYPQFFFPDATRLVSAVPIALHSGDSRAGIDITRHSVGGRSVSGKLKGQAAAYAGLLLRLVPDDLTDIGSSGDAATTFVNADGTFTFLNVPQGDYTLIADREKTELSYAAPSSPAATPPATPGLRLTTVVSWPFFPSAANRLMYAITRATGPHYSGHQRMSVESKDVADVVVEMQTTATLRMRFALEPGGPHPAGSRILFDPVRSMDALPFGAVAMSTGDEPFVIEGIPPGDYVLHSNSSWKSATFGDEECLGRPIRIDESTSGKTLVVKHLSTFARFVGIVRDNKGAPVPAANAIAFPVDETLWPEPGYEPVWIRAAQATTAGDVQFAMLPGEYYVTAVPPDRALQWPDVDLLRLAKTQATKVKLAAGATPLVEIKLLIAPPR